MGTSALDSLADTGNDNSRLHFAAIRCDGIIF
jgi:hypothetical protein